MKTKTQNIDLRDIIFKNIESKKFIAEIVSKEEGIFAGRDILVEKGTKIGVRFLFVLNDISSIKYRTVVARFIGSPKQIAICEDHLIGAISKYSGIATAASRAKQNSKEKVKIVCGAWKKMPTEIKPFIRRAVEVGGLKTKIVDEDFVYLDKNYIRMFGSIRETLKSVEKMKGKVKSIQIRGETNLIEVEALEAIESGANILMIDTGRIKDVQNVLDVLEKENKRNLVKVAFAGNIKISEIDKLTNLDIDILGIGRQIIDAPLLDMSLEVRSEFKEGIYNGTKFA